MTKNAKILFFLGACAIGYYLYKRNEKKKAQVVEKQVETPLPPTPTPTPKPTTTETEEIFYDDLVKIPEDSPKVGGGALYKHKKNGRTYKSVYTSLAGNMWYDDKGKSVRVSMAKQTPSEVELSLYKKAKEYSTRGGAYNPMVEEKRKENLKEVLKQIEAMGLKDRYSEWLSNQPKEPNRP